MIGVAHSLNIDRRCFVILNSTRKPTERPSEMPQCKAMTGLARKQTPTAAQTCSLFDVQRPIRPHIAADQTTAQTMRPRSDRKGRMLPAVRRDDNLGRA
jgi:hypothetical protein